MAQLSPFKVFWDWAFDRNPNSKIPKPTDEIPDILKYNSPITHTFLLKSLINNAKLNKYLNEYFNNIGIRYIDKEELFYFIKQCIIDFGVRRNSIYFTKWHRQTILFEKVRKKFPLLKNDDVAMLCEAIDNSVNKSAIYSALDIEKPKKEKLGKKKIKAKKISAKKFITLNFNVMEE